MDPIERLNSLSEESSDFSFRFLYFDQCREDPNIFLQETGHMIEFIEELKKRFDHSLMIKLTQHRSHLFT